MTYAFHNPGWNSSRRHAAIKAELVPHIALARLWRYFQEGPMTKRGNVHAILATRSFLFPLDGLWVDQRGTSHESRGCCQSKPPNRSVRLVEPATIRHGVRGPSPA